MLQNKIYQNFIKEILKTFFVILFGLSIIAWTVRAVNYLDLIVENGYSINIYFQYSLLNLFSVWTKLIPISFLISLIIFIIKQHQENEFLILWTSGVKKLKIVNLFYITSIFILIFYLFFSVFLTPLALNKSRLLLSQSGMNSFLPTIRIQQFSDSFKGFTFLVEEKKNNEIKNIFIFDKSNVLKSLTTDRSNDATTTIVAKEGIVEDKKMILFNGQIITTQKQNLENNIIKFEQLNIDLENLNTGTIKLPKFQERSTLDLFNCLMNNSNLRTMLCKKNSKNEIKTVLNRRFILPFYIPLISLLCSLLLIKSGNKSYIFNKYSIFLISFLVLLYAELIIRYTGISKTVGLLFIFSPFVLIPIIYFLLANKLSTDSITR